jgi:hypothetical protein
LVSSWTKHPCGHASAESPEPPAFAHRACSPGLNGRSPAKSDVWHQRRFGNEVLWSGSYDDSGRSLGLSADEAPPQPTDTILFDSIRRFKGLEREVVVLVELDEPDERRDRLMYVGATRAKQHLVVFG